VRHEKQGALPFMAVLDFLEQIVLEIAPDQVCGIYEL
jgi:hypothetical protein